MRLKRYDKLMAIKNHHEFIQDHKKYKSLKRESIKSKRRMELERKWGEEIEVIEKPEKSKKIRSNCVKVVYTIEQKPIRDSALTRDNRIIERYIDGKRLYLEVDINETKENLKKEFINTITQYKKILPKNNYRNKDSTIDPWEIWSEVHNKKKKLLEIARERSGRGGNPNNDNILRSEYEQVRRVYKKAEEMIESISPN